MVCRDECGHGDLAHGADVHGDADVGHGCSSSCSCESMHDTNHDGHSHGDGHFDCTSRAGRAHHEECDPCPACHVDKCKWAERCNRKKKCRFCHCGMERVLRGPTKAKRGSRSLQKSLDQDREVAPMRMHSNSRQGLATVSEGNSALGAYSPGLLLRTWAATPVEPLELTTASLMTAPDTRSPL
eukprot:798005-Amphidinium_carterae.1